MTLITDLERRVLAGIFARTNMGQDTPKKRDVQQILSQPFNMRYAAKGGDDFAILFCAEFMETEEHETIFSEEACGWFKHFGKRGQNTREYIEKTWPAKAALMWG